MGLCLIISNITGVLMTILFTGERQSLRSPHAKNEFIAKQSNFAKESLISFHFS